MTDQPPDTQPKDVRRFRAALQPLGAARLRFRRWRRDRPFWGGTFIVLAGLEIVGSTQMSLGNIRIQVGLEGLQAILIPVILILAGLLVWFMPVHRVFYGVIALVVSLYSLIGVNFGGFFIGMLLGILGGSLAIAWSPREPADEPPPDGGTSTEDEPTTELESGPWDDLHRPQQTQNDSIVPNMRDDRGAGSARLAFVGAVAGALLVMAIIPAGATVVAQTTGDECEPDTDPTTSPSPEPTGSPEPTETPDPDSTDESDPGLIGGLLSTVTGLLDPSDVDCEPADEPSPSPTAGPTSDPTDAPTSDPGDEPAREEASEETSDDEQTEETEETDELGLPEGFELPEDAVLTEQRTLESENPPVVAASPGRLTGSSITMTGLVYEGNVDLPTADGPLTVMKFTMDKSVVEDFSLAADAVGETLLTTTGELTISGDVTFYTDRFVGWLLGFKFTFLPETPPPFTLPIMVFSDPEIRLVAVDADVLTAPIMSQRQIS